jgi:hypothetical protein
MELPMNLSFEVSRFSLIALFLLGAGCGSAPVRNASSVRSVSSGTSGAAGPSTSPASASDPCQGSDLVLADVLAHCRVDEPYGGPPDPHALRADADPVTVTSGATAQVTLTFENSTSAPLEVWMDQPSSSFEASLWRGHTRVDARTGARGEASPTCTGDCRAVRVVLLPGGYLRGAVDVSARAQVMAVEPMDGVLEQIVPHDAGPLAPGEYQLAVSLPWSDGGADAVVMREVRSTCTVL